jgi:hypothetical protein
MTHPLQVMRHHVTGAIERGEKTAIEAQTTTLTRDQADQAARILREGQLGGFAGAIGDAYACADASNRAKLVQAFPELFAHALDIPF